MPIIARHQLIKLKDGHRIGIVGHVSHYDSGWYFHPMVSGRRPSRKFRATMEQAIPRWTGYPETVVLEQVDPRASSDS